MNFSQAEPLTLKRQFWHMTRLLRLVLNDRFDLLDERGMLEETLLRMTENCAEIKANSTVKQTQLPQTGPKWHVAAAFGHLSGHRADWLVEKCTELGAQTLTPLLTQRSATDAEECNMERWRRIGRVASKQCQRSDELDVREPTRIKSLWTEVRKAKVAFFASAGAPPLGQTLIQRSETLSQGGLLLIGPEGDFTPVEISLLIRAGAVPVGLGQQRLRVETTTIAMLSTVILLAEGSAVDAKKG
ncbi:hypothetical protein M758_1G143300 [Ceratodon purpureus]|nr:hypothetical protein M758_1G143300 [Ceratodon purpureus]